MCSAYSSSSSLRWGKRKVTALDILLKAEDHSLPVLICRFDSATVNTTSALPKRPFLSSSSWIKCMEERIWWRSTDSPRRIRSHWEEGIPSGRLLATRKSDLTPERSSLNWSRVRQVSTQLILRGESDVELYQGMSSSLALLRATRCSISSPSSSPWDTRSKRSSTSSLTRFLVCGWLGRRVVPKGGDVPLVPLADRFSSWIATKELISAWYELKAFPLSLSDTPSHLLSSLATRDEAWKREQSPFLKTSISRSIRSRILSFASCAEGPTVVTAAWEDPPPFSGVVTFSKEELD